MEARWGGGGWGGAGVEAGAVGEGREGSLPTGAGGSGPVVKSRSEHRRSAVKPGGRCRYSHGRLVRCVSCGRAHDPGDLFDGKPQRGGTRVCLDLPVAPAPKLHAAPTPWRRLNTPPG